MFAATGDADVQCGFDLAQVFVQRAAEIGKSVVVDGGKADFGGFQWVTTLS
jgi:hypothetical protein